MIKVDTRGFSCPIPVVKVKKAIDNHSGKEILVLIDSDVARENVSRLAKNRGYEVHPASTEDLDILLVPKKTE